MQHEENEPPVAEHHQLMLTEPSYMAEFVCLGGICPDTCCQRWDIVLDEATCRRYAHAPDSGVRQELARGIEQRQEDDGRQVSVIRLRHGGRCPFLRSDGWCRIQRRTSEYYLSEVCRTYPQVLHVWNDVQAERALCVSCIGAAQLILGRDEPLRLVAREMDEADWAGLRITDREAKLAAGNDQLREALLMVLQQRQRPLRQRLLLADELLWQTGGLTGHHAGKQFALRLAAWQETLAESPAREPEVPSAEQQLELLRRVVQQRLESRQLRADFRQRLEEAAACWHFAAGDKVVPAVVRQYTEGRELYALLVRPAYAMFWENFLVNGVFKDVFLVDGEPLFYAAWFRLLLQVALLRLLLLTAAVTSGALPSREEAVWLAHLVGQAVGHDGLYLEQMRSFLAGGGDEAAAVREFCHQMI